MYWKNKGVFWQYSLILCPTMFFRILVKSLPTTQARIHRCGHDGHAHNINTLSKLRHYIYRIFWDIWADENTRYALKRNFNIKKKWKAMNLQTKISSRKITEVSENLSLTDSSDKIMNNQVKIYCRKIMEMLQKLVTYNSEKIMKIQTRIPQEKSWKCQKIFH